MKDCFTYPQETWTAAKCEKVAKHRGRDGCGALHPYPGLVAGSASTFPQYGQRMRFNGGTIINGEHYASVEVPLPKIPPGFKFVKRVSWGTYLEKVA